MTARLRPSDKKNFATLLKAIQNGDFALVSSKRLSDGADVALICALGKDGEEILITPFAVMVEGNPYDSYEPPSTDDE